MTIPCPWPNVRAIIEREIAGVLHIVIQRRVKPNEPSLLELPGGSLEKFEPMVDCLHREVMEETGLSVIRIIDNTNRVLATNNGDRAVETVTPFAVYQTVRGDFPSMGVYFRCHADGELLSEGDGAAAARWIAIDDLKQLTSEDPDRFMTFDLSGIRQYLRFLESS